MTTPQPKPAFSFPRVVAWEVTRQCPLKCKHCRASAANISYSNELSTAECKLVIDSLCAATPHPPMIIWTGGEPMLRADIIELVSYATSKGIRSVMAPCGALVTKENLQALKAAGVMACSFSLDGADAATHDAFRGIDGAYEKVTNAMRIARETKMPFQVNTTVSTLNKNSLDDIYAKSLELGAAKLDVFFLVPVGRGKGIADYALSAEETKQVLDWCFNKAITGPLAIKETCCPAAPGYWREFMAANPPACASKHSPCGCLGGRGFAFLSHTGNLQTCGFIDVPCGNIRDAGFNFASLIKNAGNPLGVTGTCRSIFKTSNED